MPVSLLCWEDSFGALLCVRKFVVAAYLRSNASHYVLLGNYAMNSPKIPINKPFEMTLSLHNFMFG